ncbi:hypothetical protein [Roseospira navarrensis]|uniref:Uncharacterized protein n=1 Tax=Roseospira navarrensis TaxID=140058 RepID=A0A7X1ZJU9_9PROT|nr:hypothetical protein [Roseospira navarrensis]MQX38595.1 hypothetical protein [Roseospira navarrensis]
MPTTAELIKEIDGYLLSSSPPHSYTSTSAAYDVYEGYVWTIVLSAAEYNGATVLFEDTNNNAASSIILRTNPGSIYSNVRNYTHAVLRFPGSTPELEAHLGIYVSGKSGIPHECDIAVIDRDEAIACRQAEVHPRARKLLMSVECKLFSSNLGVSVGRGFLGLTRDIISENRFFVSNSTSERVKKLIAYHKASWECPVVPSATDKVQNLRSQFSTCFRDYVAKGRI